MLILRQLKVASAIPKILSNNSTRNFKNVTSITSTIDKAFLFENPELSTKAQIDAILVKPGSIGYNIGIRNPSIRKEIFELPLTNKIVENPQKNNLNIIEEISKIEKTIELPTANGSKDENDVGKQAARLIVIRRRKMKKHKLKKLRKKMKFVWAKVRQKRELKKEKRFQGRLVRQIKNAEKFSAEAYVDEKIKKATEVPIPRFWKGKRLPEFIIREKLGLTQEKK